MPKSGDYELRAYRLCLDPTPAQRDMLARSAGAARKAYNFAIDAKTSAHRQWRAQVDALIALGVDPALARRQIRIPIPSKPDIHKQWLAQCGDSRAGRDGIAPWTHEHSTYVFQSAFLDADSAWRNWLNSRAGDRAGKTIGYPRFKKKGRCRDSFRIHHDVTKPTIRPEGYRRLRIPKLGSLRLHTTAKPLSRAIASGAVVTSVTVSRQGHRWYAAVLVRHTPSTTYPTRAQRAAGRVGVDLGVSTLAALSTGELITNPRNVSKAARRLARAQRAFARTHKGSARRRRAAARIGRLHALLADRRATGLHTLTKRLTTHWVEVAIEDLNVAGMTTSAKGTPDKPGKKFKQKAGLNKQLLDISPHEIRRQLSYKAAWYGATLLVCDRWYPSSKTCSACGTVKPKLPLSVRVFHCEHCGYQANRDHNAARNIASAAQPITPRGPRKEGHEKRPPSARNTKAHRSEQDPADPAGPP